MSSAAEAGFDIGDLKEYEMALFRADGGWLAKLAKSFTELDLSLS